VIQKLYRFRHQWELEVIAVLDLGCRETQVYDARVTDADLDQMPFKLDRSEVLNAHRGVEQ
jgi:hypothetical protein